MPYCFFISAYASSLDVGFPLLDAGIPPVNMEWRNIYVNSVFPPYESITFLKTSYEVILTYLELKF